MTNNQIESAFLPGLSLTQKSYTAADSYRQDIAWLRQSLWLIAGHVSQIPNSGDYFLYQFDQDSVIVLRDKDGNVQAHHNVCRHRGSRLCTKESGTIGSITCPYHAWTYDLKGKLRAAPLASNDFDKSAFQLASSQVRTHHGLIFLCFAAEPPDFESFIGFLSRELELHNISTAKVARRTVISAEANWKLAVENNLECYHCRGTHPSYCAAHPGIPLGQPAEYMSHTRYERVCKSAANPESERLRNFKQVDASHESKFFQALTRQLIGVGVLTESMDGKSVAPLMGLSIFDGIQTIGLTSPLTSIILNPDHAVIYSFIPRSAQRTDMELIWLVKEGAEEGRDYNIDRLSAVFERTVQEDKILIEDVQLGVKSPSYQPGPLMQSEALVAEFGRWYLDRMVNGGSSVLS